MSLSLSLPASLLALGATVAAQTTIPGYRLYGSVDTWNTTQAGLKFFALQAGKLRTSTPRDVIALRGDELHVLANMSARDIPVRLATGVTGMILLPDMGPTQFGGGKLDALLAVTGSGAELWTWNGSAYTSSALPQLVGWGGATELRCGPGGTLFAKASSGTAILRATFGSTGISALPTLAVTGTIWDYEPMFWDTDAVVDLAVAAGTQLFVRSTANWSGTLTPGYLNATSNDLLAVSHGKAGERDLLVVYTVIGGSGYLTAGNSARIDPTISLNATLGGLESFAFDRGTGTVREDLFLSLSSSRDVVQFQRLAPQPVGSQSFALPSENGVGLPYVIENDEGLTSTPTFATRTFGQDVDGDGDQDVLSGLADLDQLQVLLNGRLERFDVICPSVWPLGLTHSGGAYSFPWFGSMEYGRRASGATHLRMEVRCQPGGMSYDPGAPTQFAQGSGANVVGPGIWDFALPSAPKGGLPQMIWSTAFTLTGVALDSAGNVTGAVAYDDLIQFTLYEITKSGSTVTQRFAPVTYFCSFESFTRAAYLALPEISQYQPSPLQSTGSSSPSVHQAAGLGAGYGGGVRYDFATGSGGTVIGGRGLGGP